MHDSGETLSSAHDATSLGQLLSQDVMRPISAVLGFSVPVSDETNGFLGVSDGLKGLKQDFSIKNQIKTANNGNVVQIARIMSPSNFKTVLSFGKSSIEAAKTNFKVLNNNTFESIRAEYEKGWADYVKTLPKVDPKYQAQWDKKEVPNSDPQFVPPLKFGEGTGSATPLAWSMAQFIRLAVNLKAGRNLDTPKVVYDRYVLGKRK